MTFPNERFVRESYVIYSILDVFIQLDAKQLHVLLPHFNFVTLPKVYNVFSFTTFCTHTRIKKNNVKIQWTHFFLFATCTMHILYVELALKLSLITFDTHTYPSNVQDEARQVSGSVRICRTKNVGFNREKHFSEYSTKISRFFFCFFLFIFCL